MHLALWYVVLVCHQYVCENYVVSVYIGGYGGLSECGLCVFRELCPVSFLLVGECPSVLLLLLFALGHGSSQSRFSSSRQLNSRIDSTGLLHRSDGINVVGWAGQAKRCLTSCVVLPQSAQTSRLASFFILLL